MVYKKPPTLVNKSKIAAPKAKPVQPMNLADFAEKMKAGKKPSYPTGKK